jgi:hypothetical protein
MVKKFRLATLGAVILFYITLYLTDWWPLKITGIKGYENFIDLGFVLDMASCLNDPNQDVTKHFDGKACSGYIYGSALLKTIKFFGIANLSQELIGVLLGISLIGLLLFATYSSKLAIYAQLLIVCSPGIWLLLERGNIDIVMVLLTALSVFSFSRNFFYLGLIVIIYATIIKFYTAPLFLLVLFFANSKLKKITLFLTFIPTLFFVYNEISKLGNFPSTWYVSFGIQSIGLWVQLAIQRLMQPDFAMNTSILMGVGICFQAVVTLGVFRAKFFRSTIDRIRYINRSSENNLQVNAYKFYLLIFVGCYFAGMNYDYRLIFLALGAMPILPELHGKERKLFLILTLLSLWFSCFFFGIKGIAFVSIQAIGDIATSVLVAILVLGLLGSLKEKLIQKLKEFPSWH